MIETEPTPIRQSFVDWPDDALPWYRRWWLTLRLVFRRG
jgi:hypothetical protein